MILALLLAATAVHSQPPATIGHALMLLAKDGQQQAGFKAAMAPEAWLLDPDVQPAQAVLDRTATLAPRTWWPARTVTSCDGSLALSTGTFRDTGAAARRYLTVWERQPDFQWRWVFDAPIPEAGSATKATDVDLTAACGRVKPVDPDATWEVSGESGDGTLRWRLVREGDGESEKRRFVAEYLSKSGWSVFEDATVG